MKTALFQKLKKQILQKANRSLFTSFLILSLFLSSLPHPIVYANVEPATESAEVALPDPSTLDVTVNPTTPTPTSTPAPVALPDPLDVVHDEQNTVVSAQVRQIPHLRKMGKDSFGSNEKVEVRVDNGTQEPVRIAVKNSNGDPISLEIFEQDFGTTKNFTIHPPSNFAPGKYTALLTDSQGYTTQQDFYWGVLALNMNKATFSPGETAEFSIAVLDDRGKMVCDASVDLSISKPDGTPVTLSTNDKSIIINPECWTKEVTVVPDYSAEFEISALGTYALSLSATTASGTHTITDQFTVSDKIVYDVSRKAPTRIFPINSYPVEITIIADQDFEGVATEIVPDEFSITQHPDFSDGYDSVTNESEREQLKENPDVLGASVHLALPYKGSQILTQHFGGRHPDPIIQTKYEKYGVVGHDGADFAMPVGTPVYSVDEGTVAIAQENGDYGTTIVIEHPWGKTYYGHLSELLVDTGDHVKSGEQIAMSGNTGLSTGPHLHFGMKLNVNNPTNGYYGKIDPLPFIGLAEFPSSNVLGATTTVSDQRVKVVSWNLSLKKGERKVIGYMFDAPDISPQFYTTGPLKLLDKDGAIVFEEGRRWQIASDDVGVDTYTSTTTWTAPPGVTSVTVAVWGAGGGGGGQWQTTSDGGGGGGGGGYSSSTVGVNPGSTYTVTVGTGGYAGGTNSVAECGGTGGDSWFKDTSTVLAKGGAPGCHSTGTPPAGGTGGQSSGGVGTTKWSGGQGGTGRNNGTGTGGGGGESGCTTTNGNIGGTGGASPGAGGTGCDGGDGGAGTVADTVNGNPGTSPGGGGGGSGDWSAGGGVKGGAGADGMVRITYNYTPQLPKLTLEGYTFENDDEDQSTGDAVDSNTVLAGTSFTSGKTLTSVKKGERLTVRMHLSNTASPSASQSLALFYDRNDNIWTKAAASTSASLTAGNGNCTDTNWNCNAIISANEAGQYTSMAVDPYGKPWIVYYENFTTSCNDTPTSECSLGVATYVGTGGTGCESPAWQCTIIDNPTTTSDVGQYASIAFNKSGVPWVSYYDVTNTALKVATYVGTGGTGCTGSTAWSCETVDNTGTATGSYTSIVVDGNGYPWVSFYDTTNTALRVATRGGGFGTTCTDVDWTCGAVDQDTDDTGMYTSIALDNLKYPWVSYYDNTLNALSVAQYVGSGGSGCGASGSSSWSCESVDNTNTNTGTYTSIAFDPNGKPWVSFQDGGNSSLRAATRGGGFGSTCTDTDWTCGDVDADTDITGAYSAIAFDPRGRAWASYYDDSSDQLMVAHYVGSGGSGCGTSGSSEWTCTAVDNTGTDTGSHTSIAFEPNGNAMVSFYDTTNTALRVARITRGGEIFVTPGLGGITADSIQASHADMTSATDSGSKTDADCLNATTWNNGKWFESEEGYGWSIANGTSTSQCTEVAFTIDTSKAIAGTTYRLIVATDDNWSQDRDKWRGPISVATNGYPTLTIESSTVRRYSKDSIAQLGTCTDTNWGCYTVDATNVLGDFWIGLTIDTSGTPWITYYEDTTSDVLHVATYVGSGGNCDNTGGHDAWQCTSVDTSAAIIGANGGITSDKDGHIWVSYRDSTNGDLKVATNWDHPNMSACSASGWDCEIVDGTSASMGFETAISVDKGNRVWITYRDATNTDLRYARYVGSGGNCTSTNWDCGDIDDTGGEDTSITFDDNGKAWVSYFNTGSTELRVAEYVGIGGNCSGSTVWSCTTVDTVAASVGNYTGMVIDKTGIPWVIYHQNGAVDHGLKIATKQDHAGMSACSATGWDCTRIDSLPSAGADPSLAFDEKNDPLIVYYTDTTMRWAKYVGGGTGTCTDTNWNCTTLDSQVADTGEYSHNALKFDHSGVPWVAYKDVTNANIKVAKLSLPDYISDLRYPLDSGKAPATDADGTCNGTTDNMGYCGVYAQDSYYDSIQAELHGRPMYMFAERFSSNSTAPTATWQGRTGSGFSLPSTANGSDLYLQVYRFGSTNAWETLDTDTTSSNCNSVDCELTGTAAGTASEYYKADGSNYWVYYRVYQSNNTGFAVSLNLKTGCFDGGNGDCTGGGAETPSLSQLMRGGKWFNSSGTRQPFAF